MGYWTYYLAWIALAYFTHYPWLIVGAAGMVLLRPILPDPVVWLRTQSRIRALEAQVAANTKNSVARRDLAQMYLDRLRPRKALALLEQALALDPESAELNFLIGIARLRSGRFEEALEPLVRAVDIDPRVRFGEPYLAAAEALMRLGRLAEAEDALDRYVRTNSSSVKAHVWLAQVRRAQGDERGADAALAEALSTWSQVPRYRKRAEIIWWLRAQFARILS